MSTPPTLLIIDADEPCRHRLRTTFDEKEWHVIDTPAVTHGLTSHAQHPADCIIVEAAPLPSLAQFVITARATGNPFIVARVSDEKMAMAALKAGADDCFLPSDPLALIHHRLDRAIARHSDDSGWGDERVSHHERQLLHALLDNLPDEIWAKDVDGRLLLSNKAHTRRVKHLMPPGGVVGSTNYDYMPKQRADARRRDDERLMYEIRQPVHEEHRVRIKNEDTADYEWMLVTRIPLYDDDGQPVGIVGINRDVTGIKRAEQRLNDIIESAQCLLWQASAKVIQRDDGSMTTDWDLQVISEESARRFLPMKRANQTYGQAWEEAIIDFETVKRDSDAAIFSGHESYQIEFQCRYEDNSTRWLHEEVRVTPVSPTMYYLVGVVTDITQRKEAEIALQRVNEQLERRVQERTQELSHSNVILRLQIAERQRAESAEREQRQLAEALRDSALALSQSLKLDDVLDRLMTAVSRVLPPNRSVSISLIEDSIYVRAIRHHFREDGGVNVKSYDNRYFLVSFPVYDEIYRTNQPIVIEDVTHDPRWIPLEGNEWIRSYMCVPIASEGHVIGFINVSSARKGVFDRTHADKLLAFSSQAALAIRNARLFETTKRHAQDMRQQVTDRTRELESERAQLSAILDAMTEGVIYSTFDGTNLYVNTSLTRMTRYDEAVWLKRPLQVELYTGEIPAAEFFGRARMTLMRQGFWRDEMQIKRWDGEIFTASITQTLVHSRGQEAPAVVTVIRDISAEKRLEAQKARFIATASHELRTPITNIKTRLYLLQKQPDTLEKHLPVLVSVTERMRNLVEDLLDVSRFEHGVIALNTEPTAVQDVVRDVVEVQLPEAEKIALTLEYDAPPEPLWAMLDTPRMQQVITNLLSNAINYTPEGGQITVSVAATTYDDRRCVVIRVRDSGVGIPAHLIADIFKPFFRVSDHHSGVGLGLSITKEIVEAHDGAITVDSAEGEGTCFSVWLPQMEQ